MTAMTVVWQWPETPILIGVTLLVAFLATWLLRRTVGAVTSHALTAAERHSSDSTTRASRILAAAAGLSRERYAQRTATLGSLLRSIINVTMITITALTVLSILDVPLGPLLTSAGIGGVAFAFGAQSLVKDYLSGIFMIVEDQYGVGDTIDTGAVSGTVEEVGLRITKLRDGSGQIWYVRNGEITRIGNQSQGWSMAIVEVPVASDNDPAVVLATLNAVADSLDVDPAWGEQLLERPTVVGIDSVSGSTMIAKVVAKTPPASQAGIQRELLARCLVALQSSEVRLPG
jgi:moderate conductance mechanosensitive channel